MSELSTTLLSVIYSLPSSIPTSLTSKYKQVIQSNAKALDDVYLAAQDSSSTARANQACQALKILLDNRVITLQYNAEQYEELRRRNWSRTCWLPAAGFIQLQNVVEVALAMKINVLLGIKFAVRSGGHSPNPGFGSVGEEGVVLDLGEMNEIALSEDGHVVSVGPGITWDAIYEELEKMGRTVVGGRATGVGVAGLITGGGMSHFSNHWGLACDHVKSFEVVLADSSVINANVEENADLFRALKGGGANFGIVTRFDLHTNHDFGVWYTFKVYSHSDVDRVMEAAIKVQMAMDEDDRIGFFLVVQPACLIAGMLYRGHSETMPSAFHAFDGIEPLTTAVPETNGTQLSVARAAAMDEVAMREIGTVAVRPDAELYIELSAVLQRIAKGNSPLPFLLQFTFQPIGAAAAKEGEKHGGNVLNLLSNNMAWLGFVAQWTDGKDAELARSLIRELITGVEEVAKKTGLWEDFYFMNDASYWQNPLKSYGSLEWLRKISKKWDPDGVFQKQQSGGFLLSKVDNP